MKGEIEKIIQFSKTKKEIKKNKDKNWHGKNNNIVIKRWNWKEQ